MAKKIYIGCDESLKGDTFGGIVLCGFYCVETDLELLKNIGVNDSKKITDTKIYSIFDIISEKFSDNFVVFNITPKEYNQKIIFKKITQIMNESYVAIISKLMEKISPHDNLDFEIVLDKYPGSDVLLDVFPSLILETKADQNYIAVSTASIIARYYALEQIKDLSKKANYKLPLGSVHVESALQKIKEKNLNPDEFLKTDFKNVKAVFK